MSSVMRRAVLACGPLLLASCQQPLFAQGPFPPPGSTTMTGTYGPGPASGQVVYQNSHMPLVGQVPIRSRIVLTPKPNGSFTASAVTSAPGVGSGQLSGTAFRRGSEIIITQPASRNGPSCTLTMSPVRGQADAMAVAEGQGCNQWHGGGVEFEGVYQRAAGSGTATTAASIPPAGGSGTQVASACPASLGGHRAEGAQLYQGPPEENAHQAPGTPAGPNTYAVGDSSGPYFARCTYRGTAITQLIQLSPGLSLCRYASGTRFTCK